MIHQQRLLSMAHVSPLIPQVEQTLSSTSPSALAVSVLLWFVLNKEQTDGFNSGHGEEENRQKWIQKPK